MDAQLDKSMKYVRLLWAAGVCLLVLFMAGCGGGSSSTTPTPPPSSDVTVAISPTTSTVGYGATQQFTATVTGSTNTAVTWSVSSATSSSSTEIGVVSSAGLYTAPAATSVPEAPTADSVNVTAGDTTSDVNIAVPPLNSVTSITVTATSQADLSRSASASVTLSGISVMAVGQCIQSTTSSNTLNCSGGSTGTDVSPGQTTYLFVAGTGILPGTSYTVSGNDVVVTQPVTSQFQAANDGTPAVYFQIVVSPTAVPGQRNLVVRNSGNELTSFAGAILIK